MRKFDRQNALVAATVLLCFMVTLGCVHIFSGEGILGAIGTEEARSMWAVVKGGYPTKDTALGDAALIRMRGGAGYVSALDGYEVYFAVYKDRDSAENALSRISENSAYVKELSIKTNQHKYTDKQTEQAVKDALLYFELCFNVFAEVADGLSAGTVAVPEADTKLDVLYARVEEIKDVFYDFCKGRDDPMFTEVKVALITALALIANVDRSGSVAEYVSSVRYQSVQLVMLRV